MEEQVVGPDPFPADARGRTGIGCLGSRFAALCRGGQQEPPRSAHQNPGRGRQMTNSPASPPRPGEKPATDRTVLSRLAGLKAMSVNELKEEWERLFATGAPNNSRSYLEIRLSYRIQELTHGGLSKKSRQMLKVLSAEMNGKRMGGHPKMLDDRKPIPGTRLIREWQGVTHVVAPL